MTNKDMAISLETIVGLKASINAYTPLLECIVNSIKSIQEKGISDGMVTVQINRAPKQKTISGDMGKAPSEKIIGFQVIDNGIGFTEGKTKAFDEPFTDNNFDNGGKGYGRFTTLKVFENINIESIFFENGVSKRRKFSLRFSPNKKNERDIISDENIEDMPNGSLEKTIIKLSGIKSFFVDKINARTETIAKRIFEHLLPHFLTPDKYFPTIIISDDDEEIVLNDLLDEEKTKTWLIKEKRITLGSNNLKLNLVGIHGPIKSTTQIILTAHKRAVTDVNISKYVPEFTSTFSEKRGETQELTFYVKAYVSGDYLDTNVDFQRESFSIPETKKEDDLFSMLSKNEIEEYVANLIKDMYLADYKKKFDKKIKDIKEIINKDMPFFSKIINYIDQKKLPATKDKKVIAKKLYEAQFDLEMEMRKQGDKLLNKGIFDGEEFEEYSKKVSDLNADALARYILGRADTIKLLKEYLKINHKIKHHKTEDVLHNLIYPMNTTSEDLENPYCDHNLWLLNENLVFSQYVVSDKSIFNKSGKRVDLAIFNNETVFRDNNNTSTPVFVYEFKRPGDKLEKKDHIKQLKNYILKLHKKQLKKNFDNRPINIEEQTPIYGYLVADLCDKITEDAEIHNFIKTPDGKGYYAYYNQGNAYIEIMSRDRVIENVEKRHQAFFKKLGIE